MTTFKQLYFSEQFLGAFTKLCKANILASSCLCLFVRSHGTNGLKIEEH